MKGNTRGCRLWRPEGSGWRAFGSGRAGFDGAVSAGRRNRLPHLGNMNRRRFLATAASAPMLRAVDTRPVPNYRVVTKYKAARAGMPGPYPGRVVTVHSPDCIDEVTEKVHVPTV